MAIQDNKPGEEARNKKTVDESKPDSAKAEEKGESAQIKNAHAVGDGSYGRNDGSVSDESEFGDSGLTANGESPY